MSPKLCKAESEASHLQISKERILSRSENIFKGSISVTEHQGQKWEIWAKAKPEIISDVPSHPFTKGLQLESPQVPLSLSPSLPSSLGMSLRCRSQASSSRVRPPANDAEFKISSLGQKAVRKAVDQFDNRLLHLHQCFRSHLWEK